MRIVRRIQKREILFAMHFSGLINPRSAPNNGMMIP